MIPVAIVPVDADPRAYPRSAERAAAEAEEAFDSLEPDITAANADREVRLGQPAAVLAEYAAEQDAEIIVVGSRGRGAWSSAVLGSVSSDLARVAPCPVMIVPDHAAVQSRTA